MDLTINYLTTTTQPAPSGVIFIYTMIETYMVTKIYGNGFYIAINKVDEYGFSDTKPFFFFLPFFLLLQLMVMDLLYILMGRRSTDLWN
jgi:hypothetical protein